MYQKCDFYDCTTGLSINTFLTNITSSYSNSILFLSVANILVFSFFVFWVDRNMNLWMISLRWWELNENESIMTIILYLIIQSWICIYLKLRSMTRITYMIEPPKDQSTHQITLYSSSYSFFFSSLWVERKRVILRSKLSILLFQRHGLPFSLLILIILSPIDSIMLLILCLLLAHFPLLLCFPRYVYPSLTILKGIAAGPKMMILNDSSSLISDSISFQLLSDRFYKYSFHYLFAMMNRLIGLHQDFTNHSTVHILLSIHSLAFHPSLILSFLFSIRDQYHYYQPIPWFVSLSQTNFECIWWFSSSPCIVVISTTIRPICAFTFYSGPILLSILPSILLLL